MKCKICDSTNLREISANNKIYYHCLDCEFIFIDSNYLISSDEELSQYNQHNNSIENEGYVNMFENFIKEAISPFIKEGKALDFGSGPGPVLSELLKRKGFDVNIYDPFYAPNLPSDKFDLISSTEVFEHFINPLENIELILSLLNKNGILAIMTNFHYNSEESFKKWWYIRDPTHISFYTKKTFEYLAKKYNLEYIFNNEKNISTFKKK